MKILVTGGLGFIGSHTVVELIENGHDVVIIDDLSNSKLEVKDRLKLITGKDIPCYVGDVCDKELLDKIFNEHKIDGVIHFAGYKAVGESVRLPLKYYRNNLVNTLTLLSAMEEHDCHNFIFSSSATVYGLPEALPLTEESPVKSATSPYGETKLMIERILSDYAASNKDFNCVILRYFNPIGAHKSGLLGEDPNGIPNNLLPYINKVAVGKLPDVKVFGDDYETPDGTGVRDYIHVVDLARGHVLSLKKLQEKCGLKIYNLGTGKGTSVLELINAYQESTGVKVPYEIVGRRDGDIACNFASTTKAEEELGFKCEFSIKDACKDGYNFQVAEANRKK